MPDIIRLLPESLANQIAAGEVVQRPSSVVKELLENAIDAGATEIKLFIKDAGKALIQVIDNGSGMSETDARMSFERHATSKLKTSEDLFNIRTMGFRGEALASIAAVAQVTLKTRRPIDEVGCSIKIEASTIKEHTSEQAEKGTNISVKNLFFNVPARRNFLKSNQVEFNHVYDEWIRIALAYPEIAISFFHNDEEVMILPQAKLAQRVVHIFGSAYKGQISVCEEETPYVTIKGYIGKPEIAGKSKNKQFFYANNRFIRHSLLHHAVKDAFSGLIESDAHPFYILNFTIDPKHIDINVHPTKTEIKFDDERTIYGVLSAAVKKAISGFNLSSGLDFSESINHNAFGGKLGNTYQAPPQPSNNISNNLNWKTLYEGLESKIVNQPNSMNNASNETIEFRIESRATNKEVVDSNKPEIDPSVVFQIHNKFIVTQVRSGMMLINQEAAHERILYEKFIQMLDKKFGASQQFLFPLTMELSPTDFALVQDLETEIHALGFSFSIFGKNTIVINGVPSDVRSGDEKSLFEGFIEQYKNNKNLNIPINENLARSLAKRSAIKSGQRLSVQEMIAMVEQLFACKIPGTSPYGKPTLVLLSHDQLSEMFA
ncbi:MAG: DNA mismatch repair endonuclease MutL [Bacteroidota bacterium]|nr:DNA mismatch repair endonuclease MutL [Bacteroidota bacterium]